MKIFVFRLDPETEITAVKSHLTKKSVKFLDVECVSHDDARFKSFKVTILLSDFEKTMSADFWPTGVGCKRFWAPRNTNRNEGSGNGPAQGNADSEHNELENEDNS